MSAGLLPFQQLVTGLPAEGGELVDRGGVGGQHVDDVARRHVPQLCHRVAAAAQQLLAGWNLHTDRDNRAAALGVLATTAVLGPEGDGSGGKTPQMALQEAAGTLQQHFGRIDPPWGEVNRLRRGAVNLPVDGAPDILRAIYGKPAADGRLGAVAGDTYILFVSWDRDGQLHSESVHQFGSATERPQSPHYADQAPLYAAMRTKPVWFTEAQLVGHIVEDYRPGQPRLATPASAATPQAPL